MFCSVVVYHSIEYTFLCCSVDVLSIHSIHTLVSTLTNHTDKRLQYLKIYCSPCRTQCSIISKNVVLISTPKIYKVLHTIQFLIGYKDLFKVGF